MSAVRHLHFTRLVLLFTLVVSLMSLTLLSSRGAFLDTTDNTGNSFNSSTCFAAQPDSVQSGAATSSANGVVSVPITTVDPTLSFLMFSSRHDSNRPVGSMIRGRLNATGDAVEFERVTNEVTPVTMTIEWYVVTYLCGITVQRGEVSQATTTIDVPIASVGSTSQAFVTWSKTPSAADGSFGDNDPLVGELTSPTNLQFRVNSAFAAHIIAWQVIAFDNPADVSVQSGTTSLLGTATSTTATLSPAVDVTKTFVLASYRTAGSGPDIGANMLHAELTNSTTITFSRWISGSPDDITEITWQAIELQEGSSVQRGTQAFAATTAQQNVGITPVDTTKAYAFGSVQAGSGQNVGRSNYAGDDIIGVGSFTAELSSSQLTLTRANTAADANLGWFVVHWGTVPSAGLSGSLVPSVVEAGIVAGGETLVITLTDDTWDPTVGADNAVTAALINGIDSDGLEGSGWDAVVKTGLTFNEVTRDSSTVVTVTLPAFVGYDVTTDETITVTVPASAVASASPIVATPTFDIVTGPDLQQVHYRWRNDDGVETGASLPLQVNATGDITTTSGSDVVASGMTLTPGAGDYLVWFSGSVEGTDSNTTQNVSIYVNGVKAAHTEREIFTENSIQDTSFPVATQLYVTGVGAGDTIDVRWRTSGGTATMHERTLTVEKVTSNATWAAPEDTVLTGLAKNTTKRLRIEISNDGVGSGSVVYRLEVSDPNPVSCDNIATTWTRIDTSTHWDMVTSPYFADGDPTSNISPGLTDPGGKTFLAGELQESPTDQTTGITLSGTQFTEIEYAIEATTSATDGATYCFRLTDTGNPDSFTYTETKYGKVTLAGGV